MARYVCFELIATCRRCDSPVPLNAPLRKIRCSSCGEIVRIPPDTLGGLVNDFDEEHSQLDRGHGSAGTLFSGAGRYSYKYWRLPPRCGGCGEPLDTSGGPVDDALICSKCGTRHAYSVAPEWLRAVAPASAAIVCQSRFTGEAQREEKARSNDRAPVAMACSNCGGFMKLDMSAGRMQRCDYCESEVRVPEGLWKRLCPPVIAQEWFVILEGPTLEERREERRRQDLQEEKRELRNRSAPDLRKGRSSGAIRRVTRVVSAVAALPLLVVLAFLATGSSFEDVGILLALSVAVLFLSVIMVPAFSREISYRWGWAGRCRRALSQLAQGRGWEHQGHQHGTAMGWIRAELDGRDVEIHPDEEYAMEVEVEDPAIYLKTEAPASPTNELERFTTGNVEFDSHFPIRYARRELAAAIEENPAILLEAFEPFLSRWRGALARLRLDWSSLEAHLAPGHKSKGSTRWLYPEDIEPLLDSMVELARRIEGIPAPE